MIELRDTVLIEAPPEQVWAWLADLPHHYGAWHPAHRCCWYAKGHSLETGAVLVVEEELHGRPHRLRLRTTEVVPNRLLRYSSRGVRGAFRLEEANGGTQFTATLGFGVAVPILGRIADGVMGRVLGARLAAIEEHMREEGRNLKRLLEHEAA